VNILVVEEERDMQIALQIEEVFQLVRIVAGLAWIVRAAIRLASHRRRRQIHYYSSYHPLPLLL
jgi:hypothetical protein